MTVHDKFLIHSDDELLSISVDNTYSFFDGAVSFLAGLFATNLLIDAYQSKAVPYQDGHYIFFEGRRKATNKIYYFFPYDIYEYLLSHQWPTSLKIHFKEKTFDDQENIDGSITGFSKVFLSLGQATFLQFWEDTKQKLVKAYGSDQTKWSNLFQFGWIIRNALAHDFKIAVNNQKIDNVTWNGLSFGYSSNGQDISEQIMFVELIILMKEIEDELKNNQST
jgi:hypothetical protein